MQTRLWWCLWCGLALSAFGGRLESGGRFGVGAFCRNLASVAVKMFSHLIHFYKKMYTFCTFNAICKDNIAKKLYHCSKQKRFTPVNSTDIKRLCMSSCITVVRLAANEATRDTCDYTALSHIYFQEYSVQILFAVVV
jgi:hypothetical protein